MLAENVKLTHEDIYLTLSDMKSSKRYKWMECKVEVDAT